MNIPSKPRLLIMGQAWQSAILRLTAAVKPGSEQEEDAGFVTACFEQLYSEKHKANSDDRIEAICTDFYYHWHNAPGTNTQQGFKDWWEKNRSKYL